MSFYVNPSCPPAGPVWDGNIYGRGNHGGHCPAPQLPPHTHTQGGAGRGGGWLPGVPGVVGDGGGPQGPAGSGEGMMRGSQAQCGDSDPKPCQAHPGGTHGSCQRSRPTWSEPPAGALGALNFTLPSLSGGPHAPHTLPSAHSCPFPEVAGDSPTVAVIPGENRSSQNLLRRDVLPTAELPTNTILKNRSGAEGARSSWGQWTVC